MGSGEWSELNARVECVRGCYEGEERRTALRLVNCHQHYLYHVISHHHYHILIISILHGRNNDRYRIHCTIHILSRDITINTVTQYTRNSHVLC